MKKKILLSIAVCLISQWGMAQNPKWVGKAKHAVFSIVTYDKNDKILNTGNGFFVTEDGVAISDYTLFKGAYRAVVMDYTGKQMNVENIMGANDMYDVVKFRVAITDKKVAALSVTSTAASAESRVYLLPYSTREDKSCLAGIVKSADKIEGGYYYYTLEMKLDDKMVSCPIVTEEGLLFGLAQKSSGQDTATICYAVDVNFVMKQDISALSYNDFALKDIGIKKALPETEEEALIFLFMASSQLSGERYMEILDDFINQFPNSADGYLRRASQQLFMAKDEESIAKVEADMNAALRVTQKKDDVLFSRSKIIYNYVLENPENPYKDWSFSKALQEVRQAIAIQDLPVYVQLEAEILFAMQDYEASFECYDKVNKSNIASPATFFSAAKTKEMMQAPAEEILVLMDSCVARCTQPYSLENAPYLLERAQARLNAGQGRNALLDYDEYFKAVNGNVNDLFYYYREQASMKARQYQRALDDIAKAIELNPQELLYYAEQAVVNIRVGRNEEALEILDKALEIDSGYSEVYRLRGITQIQMGNKDDACDSFAKAKELGDPNVDSLIEKHCK